MKQKLVLIFLIIFISGCVVNKPSCDYASKFDYNKRRTLSNPHYIKEPSALGYITVASFTVIGGYLGYKSGFIEYQKSSEVVFSNISNTIIGSFIGLASSELINFILGQGKKNPSKDPEKWLHKVNEEYILLSHNSDISYKIIHKSAESNYTVNNLQDVHDFKNAFPESNYSNEIVTKSIIVLNREELLKLMKIYPDYPKIINIKKEYIYRSENITSLFEAFDKFPETNIDIEEYAIVYLSSLNAIEIYIKRFPNGKNYTKVEHKTIEFINNLQDAKYYDKIFQNKSYADDVELKVAKSISNIYEAEQFNQFYSKSKYANIIINNLYQKISRNHLKRLIAIYPNNKITPKMKTQYLKISNSITECAQASKLYPITSNDALLKATKYVNSLNSFRTFKKYFKDTTATNNLITNLTKNCNRDDLYEYITENPSYPKTEELKVKYVQLSKTIEECKQAASSFPVIAVIAENKAASLTNDILSCKQFLTAFPNGNNYSKVNTKLNNFAKNKFEYFIQIAKRKINDENYTEANENIEYAKDYIVDNKDREVYNETVKKLNDETQTSFANYIRNAKNYINNKNFDKARTQLEYAEIYIANSENLATYNTAVKNFNNKYQNYLDANPTWTWKLEKDDYNGWEDDQMEYNLIIYKNSEEYKRIWLPIYYNKHSGNYDLGNMFEVYLGLYSPSSEHCVCSKSYYYLTLTECIEKAIKEYMYSNY